MSWRIERAMFDDPDPKRKKYSIKEFLEIEDKDLQGYIYLNCSILIENDVMRSEDDEKIGYYLTNKAIKVNMKGTFYVKSVMREYLVYDKKTKKVRISGGNSSVYARFLKDNFHDLEVFEHWLPKATPTFCKKVFEGKINTLADVIQYHKSYTIRDKSLSLKDIYRFMIGYNKYLLYIVEDPENLERWDELDKDEIPEDLIYLKPFKFKIKDASKTRDRFDKWLNIQSKKYDTLEGLGDEKSSNNASKESLSKASSVPHKIPAF